MPRVAFDRFSWLDFAVAHDAIYRTQHRCFGEMQLRRFNLGQGFLVFRFHDFASLFSCFYQAQIRRRQLQSHSLFLDFCPVTLQVFFVHAGHVWRVPCRVLLLDLIYLFLGELASGPASAPAQAVRRPVDPGDNAVCEQRAGALQVMSAREMTFLARAAARAASRLASCSRNILSRRSRSTRSRAWSALVGLLLGL